MITQAIRNLTEAPFSIINKATSIDDVDWLVVENGHTLDTFTEAPIGLTWDTIQAEVTRLQTIYDNNQYQRARNYAPTGDQLDMLWHSIDAGIDLKQSEFYTANKAVKDANPKP